MIKKKFDSFGQFNPFVLIISVTALFVLLFSFIHLGFHPQGLLIFALAIAVLAVTLVNTNAGLIILIFSMLFSPEIPLGEVGPRFIVIRLDDMFLMVICFTWLVKMAINKQLGLLKSTSLNLPLLLYIAVCIISSLFGIIGGEISAKESFFYIIKYFEYFLLFFMVVNNISSMKQIKRFTMFLFIVCVLVSFYTYPQIGREPRVTAPFEGHGEPNTLGGYQLLLLAVSAGILLYTKLPFWRFASGGLILFTIPSFLYTLSRGSYLGFIFMYLALIIFARRKRLLLIMLLVSSFLILPFILPQVVINRLTTTFIPGKEYEVLGTTIALEDAAAARVESWKFVFQKWKKRPLLGYGVTGVRQVDNQFSLALGDTGIIGFCIFIWLLITIFKTCLRNFQAIDDDWSQGLIIGVLAGFIGIIAHAFSCQTFVVIRIMEPFWFFIAMVNFLTERGSATSSARS